jgi:hypothetical protein
MERELAATPGNDLTAAHPNSNWVFRGYAPGRLLIVREPRSASRKGHRRSRDPPSRSLSLDVEKRSLMPQMVKAPTCR